MRTANRIFTVAVVVLLAALVGCVGASAAIRIDATSDASVERSMKRMMAALPAEQRVQLQLAILQLNMAGVSSARQIVGNPDFEHPSALQVKDRIAGKTADEIMDLARRTATTKILLPGQEPGLTPDATRPLKKGPIAHRLESSRWRITEDASGHTSTFVFEFRADGSAVDEAHADQANGQTRWEQSSDEVRILINDSYAFLLGHVVDENTMSGNGGNKIGAEWTWTGERL